MNVYADHAATTPMRACAKEAMLEARPVSYTHLTLPTIRLV